MIFVTTGTLSLPFPRLINAIINLYKHQTNEKVIIQTGNYTPSNPAKHIITQPYFSFKQMIKYFQTADLVISAAGEASVFLILQHSKNMPIFIPRLKKFNEHVDNKQLIISRYLKKHQLAQVVTDISLLKNHLKKPKTNPSKINQNSPHKTPHLTNLLQHLSQITQP